MLLYFVRHGIAEDASAGTPDPARRLTSEGIRKMEREAAGMARLGVAVGTLLASPLVRARETAEIIAEALGISDRLSISDELAGGFRLGALAQIVSDCDRARAIMLVGHEPTLSMVVGELIGGGCVTFKKGAMAVVETGRVEHGAGVLRMLLPPSILVRLGTGE